VGFPAGGKSPDKTFHFYFYGYFSFSPLGIRFNSGEAYNVKIANQHEWLTGGDAISSIAVRSGTYTWWLYSMLVSTAQRRNVWIVLNHT